MIKRFTLAAAASAAIFAAAAEIPPFYPELGPALPMESPAVAPNQVELKRADGSVVKPGAFTLSRSLNGREWKILPPVRSARPFDASVDLDKGYEQPGFDDSKWDAIAVPLDWYRQYPKAYLREEPYVKGFYRRKFDVSASELDGRRALLRFGVIGYDAVVFVNGREAGRHKGDFTPCEFDVTNLVKPGENTLAIRVLTDFGTTHGTVPAAKHVYGSQWGWGNIKGGLWQSVELAFVPELYIETMLVNPVLKDSAIRVDYTIDNRSGREFKGELSLTVTTALKRDPNKTAGNLSLPVSLKPGVNTGTASVKLADPVKWSPENPFLYYLSATLADGGKVVSGAVERFGYRDFKIVDGKFHLNGERIYLFGENIRSVDFGGRGTTPAEDAANLRKYMNGFKRQGVNIIRNAHLPILPAALEIADEIGLMIYDEWGWSFTNLLDEKAFQENNDRELREWLRRDYNHPSVVMWSGANEVRHREKPDVKRQLDRQIDLIREFDKSGRPAGSFSGSASWISYGIEPLNTDFLDLHSYHGLSVNSWTRWNKNINDAYDGSLEHYKVKGDRLPWPYIIWECVGFTWGGKSDAAFRIGDMNQYAKYARSSTSWAQGNGIGYAGTIGLAASLDPKRGMSYGKALFGHRLLELARQNPRVDGFAPWQHATGFRPATLWNQPILVGLRNEQGLPPSNFFAGRDAKRELFVVNSTNHEVKNGKIRVWLLTEQGKELPLAEAALPELAPWKTAVLPVTLRMPEKPIGHAQLRATFSGADGKELSRNFYNVYLGSPAVLTDPVKCAEKVALLDVGSPADVETTGAVLKALAIPYAVIPAAKLDGAFTAAIIPAGLENSEPLKLDARKLDAWLRAGGKLLVLEQPVTSGSVLPESKPVLSPLPFADLVYPQHPVFAGLDQRNFDLWENPVEGRVITVALAPFSTNAIAVRGPLLGSQNVENAVLEALVGKGRVFWTQLDATSLWGRDSSASTYLRNVFDYMLSGRKPYEKVMPLELSSMHWSIPEGREYPIDLTKQANRGFRDDGDGTGWTGQGENDFRNMPIGLQKVNGIPFRIIDPAKNNGKSCLIVRGTEKPELPARIDGIPVNAKLSRLFFLHTCAWKGTDAGCYRINYADGTKYDYMLIPGRNIGDWWNCAFLGDAAPGILRPNPVTDQVGTYMAVWDNPFPEKEIKTIDFLSAGQNTDIDYLPGRCPVPILVAMTGERAGEAPFSVNASEWKGGGRNGVPAPEIGKVRTTLPDGRAAEVTRIAFPKVAGEQGFSYAMIRFDPAKYDPEKHRCLSMLIKADKPGALDVTIPERNWNGQMRLGFELGNRSGEWRRVRLDLSRQQGGAMRDKVLRGELFLYNGENKHYLYPRPATSLEIADIRFE